MSVPGPSCEDFVGLEDDVEGARGVRVHAGARYAHRLRGRAHARDRRALLGERIEVGETERLVLPPLDRPDEIDPLGRRIAAISADEVDLDLVVRRPEAADRRGGAKARVRQDLVDGIADQRLDRLTSVRRPIGEDGLGDDTAPASLDLAPGSDRRSA